MKFERTRGVKDIFPKSVSYYVLTIGNDGSYFDETFTVPFCRIKRFEDLPEVCQTKEIHRAYRRYKRWKNTK